MERVNVYCEIVQMLNCSSVQGSSLFNLNILTRKACLDTSAFWLTLDKLALSQSGYRAKLSSIGLAYSLQPTAIS